MSKKYVGLIGDSMDIQDLDYILNDDNWKINFIENKYLLSSSFLDSINSEYEILLKAKQFLDILNGAAKAIYNNHIYITANTVYTINEQNKLQGTAFMSGKSTGRSRFRATLTIESNEKVSENKYQKWIDKAKTDSNVREILHYFNNQDWWNLYKIYEIIRKDLKKSGMSNLVSKNEISRFTRTANDNKIIGEKARHATYDNESHNNPMDINSARKFILDYFEKWIELKE
ncbi:hypothetical protein ACFPH8_14775 [Bizionia hallyeonensis]|uniref:Uncharacterized protein n=1 Tax=Bizionia hallyeonensis TaxID=1123757 RepID=A0ABW0CBJ8_9FLAO